jgi:type II secretory pathway pseudopilin PulG
MLGSNQKGSILITVLVVLLCVTVLGAALGTLAFNDQKQTLRQQKKLEAYYLARSGADAVAAYLLANQDEIPSRIGQITQSELGNGRFEAKVTNGDNGMILIESTGFVGDYSDKVTLSLVRDFNSKMPVFDMAVFSYGGITMSGSGKVVGDIATNAIDPGAINIDWGSSAHNIYVGPDGDPNQVVTIPQWSSPSSHYSGLGNLDEYREYPVPVFPDFPMLPHKGSIILDANSSPQPISSEGYYDVIDIHNQTLVFQVGSGTLRIGVGKLKLSTSDMSKIKIEGTGTLIFYIEDEFCTLSGSAVINEAGKEEQLIAYYYGDKDLSFAGAASFYGGLFSQSDTAKLYLGGSGGVNGMVAINGPYVDITGGSSAVVSVIYAPNAHVYVHNGNSNNVNGAIVCNTFACTGRAGVTYQPEVEEIWSFIPEVEFSSGSGSGFAYRRGYWTD